MIPAKSNGSARKLSKDPTDEVKEDGGGKQPKSVKTTSSSRKGGTERQATAHAVIPCDEDEVDDVFLDCHQMDPLLSKDVLGSSRVLMSGSLPATVDESVELLNNELKGMSKEVDSLEEKVESVEVKVDGEPLLPEDTYSFLAITKQDTQNSCCRSGKTFYMGLGVLAFQALTLSLLAVDVVDLENEGNLLDIPAGVTVPVRIAQVIALIITVISQDEVRLSLNIWYFGYDEEVVRNAFCQDDCLDDSKKPAETEDTENATRVDPQTESQAKCSDKFADIMWRRWQLSAICRFAIGILGLAVAFMLMIAVDSVRELLLNFTAIEFVSNVDDAIFQLSKWGYFGATLKDDADTIADARWPLSKTDGWFYLCSCNPFCKSEKVDTKQEGRDVDTNKDSVLVSDEGEAQQQSEKRAKVSWHAAGQKEADDEQHNKGEASTCKVPIHTVWMTFIFVVVIVIWAAFIVQQGKGRYRTNAIYVQLGDEFSTALGTFSGLYTAGRYRGPGKRVDYGSADGSAIFRYCSDDRVWAFFYGNTSETNFGRGCTKSEWIRAVSSETFTFDLFDTAEDQWFYREVDTKRNLPMNIAMKEQEKSVGGQCRTKDEDDEDAFTCLGRQWACEKDLFGTSCQFPHQPCSILRIDEQYSPFIDARSWSSSYNTINKDDGSLVQTYGRPVYIGRDDISDVMFFTGRRWVLTNTDQIRSLSSNADLVAIKSFFEDEFHAHWSQYSSVFISEPVDIDTPGDNPTPIGLTWFKAERKDSEVAPDIQTPDSKQEQEAVLLCAICDTNNPCAFDGTCVDGSCECKGGSEGTLCQIIPIGNGMCNPDFNKAGYGWDGKDCCLGTCESSEYTCGTNVSTVFGLQVIEYVGFPHCSDPDQVQCDDDQTCLTKLVDFVGVEKGSQAGSFVAVSGNGAVVAQLEVATGGRDQVRVYENDGKNWIQKGDILTNSGQGARIEDVGSESAIALSRDGSVIAIAVNGYVQTYHWSLASDEWQRLGMNHSGMASVDLSNDGLTFAANTNEGNNVSIYRYSLGEDWYQLGQNITFGESDYRSMSLSGDGRTLAVSFGLEDWAFSVYQYTEDDNMWMPIGPTLSSDEIDQLNARTLQTVSLSTDGLALALGTSRHVHVFSYVSNGTESKWESKGPRIELVHARSLSLSGDGSFLMLGAKKRQVADVHVYQFNLTSRSWDQRESNIRVATNDESGTSVGISQDGSVLAFGAPNYGEEQYGIVRLMWSTLNRDSTSLSDSSTPSRSSGDSGSRIDSRPLVPIVIEVQLDKAPWESSMDLTCDEKPYGNIPRGTLTRAQSESKGRGVVYVPENASCTFIITDFSGDGMYSRNADPGFYNIYYGDMVNETTPLLATGGRVFGTQEKITFRINKEETSSLVPISLDMYLKPRSSTIVSSNSNLVGLNLICGNDDLVVTAPPGVFRTSTGFRNARFLLTKGTNCTITVGRQGETFQWNGNYIISARGGELLVEENFQLEPQDFVVPECEGCECGFKSSTSPPLTECDEDESLLRLELNTTEFGARALLNVSIGPNVTLLDYSQPCSAFAWQQCFPRDACLTYELFNTPPFPQPGKEISYRLLVDNNIVSSDTRFLGKRTCSVGNCAETKVVSVELSTDKYSADTSFEILDTEDGSIYASHGPFRKGIDDSRTFHFEHCLPAEACFSFVIKDSMADGICCENGDGQYSVFLDDELIIQGGDFGSEEQSPAFGNCTMAVPSPPDSPSPVDDAASDAVAPASYQPSTAPSATASSPNAATGNGTAPIDGPPSEGSLPPQAAPSTVTSLYRCLPTLGQSPKQCSDGSSLLRVEILFDQFPSDISFLVRNEKNGALYLEGGSYDGDSCSEARIEATACVPADVCLEFFIADTTGDGICCDSGEGYYKVFLDGDEKVQGGDFGIEEEKAFGSCQESDPPP